MPDAGVVIVCFAIALVLLASFPLVERVGERPMFDLSPVLASRPSSAVSVAAFGMTARCSPCSSSWSSTSKTSFTSRRSQTGLRLLVITGGILLAAIPAGRLSARVPVRCSSDPGCLLLGQGCCSCAGSIASSGWTELIPGLRRRWPRRWPGQPAARLDGDRRGAAAVAGMASGINSTFRQIGIATSVAALGSILAAREAGTSGAAHASAFISGLNELFLMSGLIALTAGALALLLIRQRDFVTDSVETVTELKASPAIERSAA